MGKYFAFIFLLFPLLMLAQTMGYNNASYNKKNGSPFEVSREFYKIPLGLLY